jgi:chemotaxis protein MotB
MILLMEMLGRVTSIVKNEIATAGHVRSQPLVVADNPVWDLSSKRADRVRSMLEEQGIPSQRIQRVTGYADRKPMSKNPLAIRNNRIEIILLRNPIGRR